MESIRLLEKIGIGGMSTVWKAQDKRTGNIVAVKVLNREYSDKLDEIEAFRSEEKLLSNLHHPNIAQAYEFAKDGDNWYFEMEYVDGYSFGEFLRRKMHVKEPDCLLILESVASALNYAWNEFGLVHCDIKPENIMINQDGVVKLLDLGIAHQFQFTKDGEYQRGEHIEGTPAYISPEAVYGDVEPDCRADIYSLGATLYHLATGRMLFTDLGNVETMQAHCDERMQSPDPRNYRVELTEGFAQLLEAMLVKDRDYRIQTWDDVLEMAHEVMRGTKFKPRESGAVSTILLD